MSGLRLKETFNRLLSSQYAQFIKKGVAAMFIAASISLPVAADHNDNRDLNPIESVTTHSEELRNIQDEFNRVVNDRYIVLVDRDWIELNRAINDFANDNDLRNRYLAEYVAKYGGLHIGKDYFDTVSEPELYTPHTQIIGVTPTGSNQTIKACMIYGGQGLEDGKEAVKNFIDVSRALHGDVFADADISTSLDTEKWKNFVTYHEIAHCMDDFFIGKADPVKQPDLFLANYHRAETFSDVFAVLMMAKERGVTDIAEEIANVRLAGAALSGPFQVAWSNPGSLTHHASYIYATHRPVRAAQDYLDANGTNGLQAMDYYEIAELARDIVKQNALSKYEADALMYLFATEFDMDVWDRLKPSVPYVAKRHSYALKLKDELEQALRSVLDLKHIPKNVSALELLEFDATPNEYFIEARGKTNSRLAWVRSEALAKLMVLQAGRQNATIDKLIDVYTENKDRWREALQNGSDAEKKDARENLEVLGNALSLAANEIRGGTPGAINNGISKPQINKLAPPLHMEPH